MEDCYMIKIDCHFNFNVALMFGIFSSNNIDEILENSEGVIQNAADALQKCFVEGLSEHFENLEIINLPYVGSYPQLYHKPRLKSSAFDYVNKSGRIVKGYDVEFCNIVGIKNYFRYRNSRRALARWCREKEGEKVVIVYAIHLPFLQACVDVKRIYKDLKIVLIVPDLPEFMGQREKVWYKQIFHDLNRKKLKSLYDDVDGYVLLSKFMTDRLPVGTKPWCVVEGIYDNNQIVEETTDESLPQRFILYTGTLARRYGIMNLVEAFNDILEPDYGLVICGAGDSLDEIKRYASNNKNIIYYGQCPREKILALQHQATLLVNPRTPEGEFTKYSFPSKTMEYLASGTPALIYRLPGIPDEYYNYCYNIDELGINALKNKIESIMQKTDNELNSCGSKAQQFILNKKNPIEQTKNVLELICSF